MEQMTQANEQQLEQKKITKRIIQSLWIYQLGCELSNSYERLQSLVFVHR